MKNILYVQPYASTIGGVDTVLLELVRGLPAERYRAHVVLPSPSPYTAKYEEAGATVHYAPMALFGKPTSLSYVPKNLMALWPSVSRFRQLIAELKIDLVHSHKMEMFAANIAARLGGIATVHTVHEVPTRPMWAYKTVAFVDALLADRVIVLCELSRSMFRWFGKESEKTTKIYNGISLRMPNSGVSGLRGSLGLADGTPLAITVGRITPMKGLASLVKAFATVRNHPRAPHLVVVGDVTFDHDRTYKAEAEALVDQLQISDRIHFLGVRRDVHELLAQADLFVLPSVYDVFPTVVLEAMAAALPIVASRVGGVPDMVRENGWLVSPGATDELASAIMAVLDAPAYAQRLGMAGRRVVEEEFSLGTYLTKTVNLYDEVLSG